MRGACCRPNRECALSAVVRGAKPRNVCRRCQKLHEIKHDGFRILARRDNAGVRLITHTGNDFTDAVRQRTAFVPIWLDLVAHLELREGGKSATKHQFLMVCDTFV